MTSYMESNGRYGKWRAAEVGRVQPIVLRAEVGQWTSAQAN